MKLTLSTCYYRLSSKFDHATYLAWIQNFFSIATNHHFYLVVYTDSVSFSDLQGAAAGHPNIHIVICPLEEFYNYKYFHSWMINHHWNYSLRFRIDWRVSMIWAEKISFVKRTAEENIFNTELFGWCDAGYFRSRDVDLTLGQLREWPDPRILKRLDLTKIHYACIRDDKAVQDMVSQKNDVGLPVRPIPVDSITIGGGFFLAHRDRISWWRDTFDAKLDLYFQHGRVIRDDQIILTDCIYSDPDSFCLYQEHDPRYDPWFMFQRKLLML